MPANVITRGYAAAASVVVAITGVPMTGFARAAPADSGVCGLDGVCSAAQTGCQDTPGWGNGIAGCVDRGFTEEDGCTKAGWSCKRYSQHWCKDGKPVAGMEFALGPRFNFPEKNCCACGKAADAALATPTPTSTSATTTTTSTTTPAPPKAKPAVSSAVAVATGEVYCQDTPGWTNLLRSCRGEGFTQEQGCTEEGWSCKAYEAYWCSGGAARAGQEWTLGKTFNEPEKHCCACGGGTRTRTVASGGAAVANVAAASVKPAAAAAPKPMLAAPASVKTELTTDSPTVCWKYMGELQPKVAIFEFPIEHGCQEAYGQCYWSTGDEARRRCAAWPECEALYCTRQYNEGQYVCYARKAGAYLPSPGTGDAAYHKMPCSAEQAASTVESAQMAHPAQQQPRAKTVVPENPQVCWRGPDGWLPGAMLPTDTEEHGCQLGYDQCFWPSVDQAKLRCAEWSACEALFCTSRFNSGAYVCYARRAGEQKQSQEGTGDTGYWKIPCDATANGTVTLAVEALTPGNEAASATGSLARAPPASAPGASEVCWQEHIDQASGPGLFHEIMNHGCSLAHGQCFWPTPAIGKEHCGPWAACEALYCSDKYNEGNFVCYARKAAQLFPSPGENTYTKVPCQAENAATHGRTTEAPKTETPNTQTPSEVASSVAPNCQDTRGWTNLAVACKEQGHTEERGCTAKGWNCKGYEEHWCHNGEVRKGFEWTLGARFNEPEKNCCVCGKGSAPVVTKEAVAAKTTCQDTPNWYNGFKGCQSHGYTAEEGCVAEKGFTCKQYALAGWCSEGKVVPGNEWTIGPSFGEPEQNCCVCGGGRHESAV